MCRIEEKLKGISPFLPPPRDDNIICETFEGIGNSVLRAEKNTAGELVYNNILIMSVRARARDRIISLHRSQINAFVIVFFFHNQQIANYQYLFTARIEYQRGKCGGRGNIGGRKKKRKVIAQKRRLKAMNRSAKLQNLISIFASDTCARGYF